MAEMTSFEKENPGIELFETFSHGRGIRTKNFFKEGSAVLACPSYLSLSKSDLQGKICDGCLSPKDNVQRCASCKSVYYCGQNCQRVAWSVHKMECKYLKKMTPKMPGDTVRLIALLLLKNIGKEFLQHLTSHSEEIRQGKSEMFAHVLIMLRKYFMIDEEIKSETIFDIFCKIHCNAFTISDEEMKPLGFGLYHALSFINHSCRPNCVAMFVGTRCTIRAITDIKCGVELCISYTELLRPYHVRRKELKQQYFFECKCSLCEEEERSGSLMNGLKCTNEQCLNIVGLTPESIENTCGACSSQISNLYSPTFLDKLNGNIEDVLMSMKNTLSQTETQQKALDACERLLTNVENYLHPVHFQVIRILDKASDICIEIGLWSKALHYCKRSLEGYEKFYPENHPSTGLQLYRIGKLAIFLDKLDSGMQFLFKARKVLNICHGKTHPLCKNLDELLFKTAEEKKFLSDSQPNRRKLMVTQ